MSRLKSSRATLRGALVLTLGLVVASALGGTALADGPIDVGPTHPFRTQIHWLLQHEIATGYPDNTFRGGEPVTRQAMAAFLARTADSFHRVDVQVDPAAGNIFAAQVTCDADERALAGGGRVIDTDVYLAQSTPTQGGQAWYVQFESEGNVNKNPSVLTAWALCAPATSDSEE